MNTDQFTGYATIEEIMAVYHVSRSYAYKLACTRRWGRYRHPDGRVRYRRSDVDDTLSARASLRRRSAAGKVQH